MRLPSRTPIRLLFLAGLAFVVAVHFSLKNALDWLLVEQTEVTSMDWAHHIQRNIPDVSKLARFNVQEFDEQAEHFGAILTETVTIGDIYQADFINVDCMCVLTIGGYVGSKPDHAHAAHFDLSRANSEAPEMRAMSPFGIERSKKVMTHYSRDFIEHVFENSDGHGAHNMSAQNGIPIDYALVKTLFEAEENLTRTWRHYPGHNPTILAELYHPMVVGGDVKYFLRLLVNLESITARYAMFLYSGAGFLLLLLAAAFSYPIRKMVASTAQQREADERALYLANRDVLTDVKNRHAFQTRLPKWIADAKAGHHGLIITLVDVNNFKEINDFYGHKTGDMVLKLVADTLVAQAPNGSLVARVGGDEFVIVSTCRQVQEHECIDKQQVSGALTLLIEEGARAVDITLAKGVVCYPRDGETVEDLMQHVDHAIHRAKKEGHSAIVEYDPSMERAFKERVETYKNFRLAILNHDIVPFYQPLINFQTGRVEGFEALARWQHPERGILTPAVFHEALEDREIAALLGAEMLRLISIDMEKWVREGIDFQSVGLNVSEGDLRRSGFVLDVTNAIASHNLLPKHLAIEVTENSVYGKNQSECLMKLKQLRELGCKIALDDFGTGYSSITHIKELPCSAVKVDKSFVDQVAENPADQAIIKALLELGHVLGFKLVLEGVEYQEQADFLRELGCELAQGFLYSRPVPAARVPEVIEAQNKSLVTGKPPAQGNRKRAI